MLSVLFIITASFSLFCIPLIDTETSAVYIIASAFWLSVILQQVFFWKSSIARKKINSKTPINHQKNMPIGIVAFFRNKEAAAADCTMIVAFITTLLLIAFEINIEWLIITSVVLLFASFNLHCIFNGRNYRYLKYFKSS